MDFILNNNWQMEGIAECDKRSAESIFHLVYKFFIEIFGEEIMTKEHCIIYNEIDAPYPMLITNYIPVRIRLDISGFNCWCQYIYQLSHEMTHYAIRQQKVDKDVTISWFEETICEAMSLYILYLSAQRWSECCLSNNNQQYSTSILNYLSNVYNDTSASVLKKCITYQDLKYIEENYSDTRRSRGEERNYIYSLFKSSPQDIKTIIYYTQYIQLNNIQIDFDAWLGESPNSNFVACIKTIQPDIAS